MFPFFVLVISTLLLRVLGAAELHALESWTTCLRGGLTLMFLFTASAHWGKRRRDLIAMVPRVFRRPDLMVSFTGVLEILGAAGLLIPKTATAAAVDRALPRESGASTRRPNRGRFRHRRRSWPGSARISCSVNGRNFPH
jgi:hypothetical protein